MQCSEEDKANEFINIKAVSQSGGKKLKDKRSLISFPKIRARRLEDGTDDFRLTQSDSFRTAVFQSVDSHTHASFHVDRIVQVTPYGSTVTQEVPRSLQRPFALSDRAMHFLSEELDSTRRTLPPLEREVVLSIFKRKPNDDSSKTQRLPGGVIFRAYRRAL